MSHLDLEYVSYRFEVNASLLSLLFINTYAKYFDIQF